MIVEKEKASVLEGYTIGSVFCNRLTHPGSFPFLNSDATIHYATEFYSKGELITEDQINASPYNTYIRKGLPPGPIASMPHWNRKIPIITTSSSTRKPVCTDSPKPLQNTMLGQESWVLRK